MKVKNNPIIDIGEGVPAILFGAYKFKDKQGRRIKIVRISDMTAVAGFEVEEIILMKSANETNKIVLGAVVPREVVEKVKKEAEKKKIVTSPNVILNKEGKPIK